MALEFEMNGKYFLALQDISTNHKYCSKGSIYSTIYRIGGVK
jgi:hypothetical protein